jgi:hypothetical protein
MIKKYIDYLFWKRKWFRKCFIFVPTWAIPLFGIMGADRYSSDIFVSFYLFTISLALFDRIDENKEPETPRKIRAKKAPY